MVVSRQKPGGIKLQLPSKPQLQIQAATELGSDELSEFEKLSILGRGNYGIVHKVISLKTSAIYPLKNINIDSSSGMMMISQEVDILNHTDSPYVVKCHGVFEAKPGEKAILMENMDEGALDTIVRKVGPLPETLIANIAKQVLNGLNYLHESNIIHLDIKPSNLLVNNNMEVKIGDFGVSRIVGTDGYDDSCQDGTYAYVSPERLDSHTYTNGNVYAGDVWSSGVSLWELYVGHFPFFPGQMPCLWHLDF